MTKRVSTVPNVQSPAEERLNMLTHGVGAILSACALTLMSLKAHAGGDLWAMVGAVTFGAAMVVLYTTSTIYHWLPVGRSKEIFRSADHMVIYVLIAGTYTVVSLTALRESVGWELFTAQWGMACGGITLKSIYGPDRFNAISTLGYVVMGWMALAVLGEIMAVMSTGGLALLFGGGLFYTLGVPFFLMDQSRRFFHSIWHLFVMAGSACHFFMAWRHLL